MLILCGSLSQPSFITCEVFTAVSDMEILVPTVNQVAKHLDDYIQLEEIKLQRLRLSVLQFLLNFNDHQYRQYLIQVFSV